MIQPNISVVMANYNGQAFLERAILSLLEQTYRDFEVVVVDDGSDDESWKLLIHYSRQDDRIRPVVQAHSGLVAALNHGCGLASAKYIARLDSDDIAKPWRLAEQIEYMSRHPDVALIGGRTDCIDREGRLLFHMRWPSRADGLRDFMLIDCPIAHTTVMFRTAVFRSLGGYRSLFPDAEDYDLFLRINDHYAIDNLSTTLTEYRLHSEQISYRRARQQIISGIGARIATRQRRAGKRESIVKCNQITENDLILYGVPPLRIESFVQEYLASNDQYTAGWRWKKSPFCFMIDAI